MNALLSIKKNFALKFLLVMVWTVFGFMFLINPPKAHAQQNPNYVYPANFYNPINTYEFLCGGYAEKYMVNSWISEDGVPTNDVSVSVPYGTTTVPLDFNYHIFLCHDITSGVCWQYYYYLPCEAGISSRAKLSQSISWVDNAYITSGQAAIGTSPAGQWSDISNEVYFRYWDDTTPINFSVVSTSPQGFTYDQTIIVRLDGRAANRYGSNWYCVGPNNPTRMAFGVVPVDCPIGPSYFAITVDVGPPNPTLSCPANAIITPASPEPGENFTVTVAVNYSLSTPSRPTHTMTVNVSGLYNNANAAYTTNGSQASFTTPTLTAPTAGQVNISWSLSGGRANTVNCSDTFTVRPKPYLRVYGGDVLAGGGFGASCSPVADSKIATFNKGSGIGAGTELSAQSLSAITQFASATGRTSNPQPDKGLTLANTGSGYGGDFGSGLCVKDYFADATNPSGNTTIGATNVANGAHTVRYVDGDVTINGNIMYTGSGSWANLSEIPSYYLIVRGNIKIASGVSRLDGVYIAQPNPADPTNTGKIYTCTQNDGSLIAAASLYGSCSSKLTVNGVFMARQVKFLRTNGLLKDSTNTEASSSNNIAEVFVYSPELWLINPGITPVDNNHYDSITSLPPVL